MTGLLDGANNVSILWVLRSGHHPHYRDRRLILVGVRGEMPRCCPWAFLSVLWPSKFY
jgi:hypothetical protein